jgi:hypothetical protein
LQNKFSKRHEYNPFDRRRVVPDSCIDDKACPPHMTSELEKLSFEYKAERTNFKGRNGHETSGNNECSPELH